MARGKGRLAMTLSLSLGLGLTTLRSSGGVVIDLLSALPDGSTFTRDAPAMMVNTNKSKVFVPSNTPRFDADNDNGHPLGLRIEAAHQSLVRNPVASGGASGALPTNWTTAGSTLAGLTITPLPNEVVQGITCAVVRVSGTSTGTGGAYISAEDATSANPAVAAQGQVWVASGYVGLKSGSTTGVGNVKVGMWELTSSGSALAQNGTALYKPTLDAGYFGRYSYKRTLSQATVGRVRPFVSVEWTGSGVAVDITLYFGLPQIELSPLAGTPAQNAIAIPAEVCTVPLKNLAFGGTLVVHARSPKGQIASALMQAGSATDGITIRRDVSGHCWATFVVAGATVADLDLGLWMDDIPAIVAVRWNGSRCAASLSGRPEVGAVVAGPIGINSARLGSTVSGSYWGGTLSRISLYRDSHTSTAIRSSPAWVHDEFHRADGLPVAPPNRANLSYEQIQKPSPTSSVVVASIAGSRLVTAPSGNGVQTASYTGVDFGSGRRVRRMAARGSWPTSATTNKGSIALIATALGIDPGPGAPSASQNITGGSIHNVYTNAAFQYGVFLDGSLVGPSGSGAVATAAYAVSVPLDDTTLARVGWRMLDGGFYAVEFPDGSEIVYYSPPSDAKNGRYAIFESFSLPELSEPRFSEIYIEAT